MAHQPQPTPKMDNNPTAVAKARQKLADARIIENKLNQAIVVRDAFRAANGIRLNHSNQGENPTFNFKDASPYAGKPSDYPTAYDFVAAQETEINKLAAVFVADCLRLCDGEVARLESWLADLLA